MVTKEELDKQFAEELAKRKKENLEKDMARREEFAKRMKAKISYTQEVPQQQVSALKKKFGRNLSEADIERLDQLQQLQKARALQKYIEGSKQTAKQYQYARQQAAYARTGAGKISAGVQSVMQPGFLRRWSYGSQIAPRGYSTGQRGIRRKGAGRPRGTLDPRYAAYGGVYGYRKAMSHQRQLEKLKLRQAMTVTPEQQQIINQINAQRMASMQNPEARVIPSTMGEVNMGGIMQEIDAATHIFE